MVRSSSVDQRFGDALGRAECRGGHDVQVAGVGRQVMGGAFHFQEDGGLQAAEAAQARDVHGLVFRDLVKLHFLLQAITGDIAVDRLDHFFHGGFYFRLVGGIGQYVDGVPHQQGWLGRIQDDDGLALLGAAHHFDGPGGGLRELVDVGSGAGESSPGHRR